ncbi:MAG: carboxylate--amine ligase [Solirubrobacteraceae bacterium]
MPAVLLGGALNALSVARSLRAQGVSVDVLGDGRIEPLVRHSRACRRFVAVPDGQQRVEVWMAWLAEADPAVLLPCSDEGVEFIAGHRAALERHGHRPVQANDQALSDMLDKARTYELAREAGVPAPRTLTVSDIADLESLRFPFPCAIKPRYSHSFTSQFKPDAKAVTVSDGDEARRLLEPILAAGHSMLLTEVIPGRDDRFRSYYTYMDEEGEPILHFTKRKLRQYPAHFGLGSYHLTEWHPEVASLGLRFARHAGLRGIVNVEFKQDERDGCFKLIECNPRVTAADVQVRAAGLHLALIAYNRLLGEPMPQLGPFKDGLGLWFPLDDIRALREYRSVGQLTYAQWVSTMLHRQVAPVFSRSDPKPSMVAWSRRARAISRRFAKPAANPASEPQSASPEACASKAW